VAIGNGGKEVSMPIPLSPPPMSFTPPFVQVMVFVDGGYLREGCQTLLGHGKIDFQKLVQSIVYKVPNFPGVGEITRIYYYDAIVDPSVDLQKHKRQKEYFHVVGLNPGFEVKLGRQVKTSSGEYRQKGVDILISIDMLTKAFQNFYDVAGFIAGDDDFVDLVKTVKDLTNKRVYGAAFQHNVSERLLESFDGSYIITKEDCKNAASV